MAILERLKLVILYLFFDLILKTFSTKNPRAILTGDLFYQVRKIYASSSSSSDESSTEPRALLTETTTAFAGSRIVTPGNSTCFTRIA